MTTPESGFDLADAVTAVRDQLLKAAARGVDEQVKFEVGPMTLEFTVELRRGGGGKVGIRAWVVSAEASGSVSRQDTHKVSLVLTPVDAKTKGKILVGDDEKPSTALFPTAG